MSFQLLLQSGLYNLLLYSQKRQTTCKGNLMPAPPPPPGNLEKVNSDKYLTRYFLFKKLWFLILDTQFELFNNNTTGKIIN